MLDVSILLSILIADIQSDTDRSARRSHLDTCVSATAVIQAPCKLPTRLSPKGVTALLGARSSVWWVVADRLTFIARPQEGRWPRLCCAIQTDLEPVPDTRLAGITVRVPRANDAILDVTNSASEFFAPPQEIRGINAPPSPPVAKPLQGRLIPFAMNSKELGETRKGTIYVPAAIQEGTLLPVIYLADGATYQFARILEAAVRNRRAAPTIIVGIDSADGMVQNCGKPYCDRRNLDYIANQTTSESQPDAQFQRHLRFVADELVPWVETTYPASPRREDRVVAGYSSGAAWAFAAAALRPELFGNVLGMSSGSSATIPYAAKLRNARVYTGAGLFEPPFLRATRERAQLARSAGSDVRFRELVAGHSMSMWEILFADGIGWLLPPVRTRNFHDEGPVRMGTR